MKQIDKFSKSIFGHHVTNTEHTQSMIYDTRVFNNAVWSPNEEVVRFGTVDPSIFNSFADHLDIGAHEFAHALTTFHSAGQLLELI